MNSDDTPRQVPTDAEVAQATAYMTAAARGFGILFEHWTGWGDGTATTVDGEGNRLIYTADELHVFDAVIPCARHGRHRVGVTYPHEFDKAIADTHACSSNAPQSPKPVSDPPTMSDPPTVTLRPVRTPTPLWLITRAAETPGRDRQGPAAS